MTERHSIPVAVKAATARDGTFTGYASTFNGAPDSYGDIIQTGAFAKSLAEHKSQGTMPALLWAHDQSEPIGVWSSLVEDTKGLRVTGRLSLDVPRAASAYALMKDGALGLSIGYRTIDSERASRGRLLKELQLFEISAVAIPANSSARITSVKSFDPTDPRLLEQVLRDAGYPRTMAKSITARGKAAFIPRDVDETDHRVLAQFIKASASKIRNSIKE